MNKTTLYRRPRDEELWEWARGHAAETGLSISHVVSQALREYRARVEAATHRDEIDR